ncbi:MAG: DUF1269 domain-containing protein, partial [Chloroflexota bacterium]|jgi:uncharacterized membrane protein
VLKFKTAQGAEEALQQVESLQRQQLITLHDAAWVTWPEGKKKPKTKQLANLTGLGALDGAFWGMLFGLIFFVPFFGMAIGAAMGGLAGKFSDVGIDDDFIEEVRSQVTEGTSALFLYTSGAVMDRVQEAMKAMDFEIIATNLSAEEEQELREAFAD